jgi:hypothetical protein
MWQWNSLCTSPATYEIETNFYLSTIPYHTSSHLYYLSTQLNSHPFPTIPNVISRLATPWSPIQGILQLCKIVFMYNSIHQSNIDNQYTSTHFLRAKSRPHPWTKSFCRKQFIRIHTSNEAKRTVGNTTPPESYAIHSAMHPLRTQLP